MESRLHHDFGKIRVPTDPRAADSSDAVNAEAYTVGQHLVFARGRFAPHRPAGQQLLAHELTHAIQQSGTGALAGEIQVQPGGHPSEMEAGRVAMAFDRELGTAAAGSLARREAVRTSGAKSMVQRKTRERAWASAPTDAGTSAAT